MSVRIVGSRQLIGHGYEFWLSCGCVARMDNDAFLIHESKSAYTDAFEALLTEHRCEPLALPHAQLALQAGAVKT